MHVLVVESRPQYQDRFLEVLSWFNAVKLVLLADDTQDITVQGTPIEAVVVGRLSGSSVEAGVIKARQTFPTARIIAAVDSEGLSNDQERLRSAGADDVVDTRISLWKTGLLMREMLWGSNTPQHIDNYSGVPGFRVEAV